MIKIKKYLDEKIYDPELGDGVSSTEYIFEKYYKNKDVEDYFISFTKIDKLGINPQSDYNTPIGIYTYPVKEFFDQYVRLNKKKVEKLSFKIGEFAPFAGDNPYVWVVKVDRSAGKFIEDISETYTEKDYERDINWIIENKWKSLFRHASRSFLEKMIFFVQRAAMKLDLIDPLTELNTREASEYVKNNEEVRYNVIRRFIDEWSEQTKHNSPGGQIWNVTRKVAKENPVKWNALWRDMGYIGVADRSGASSIIHEAENIQTVFFSVKGFDIVDKIDNVEAAKTKEIRIEKLRRTIKDYILSIIGKIVDFNNPKLDNVHIPLMLKRIIIEFDEYLQSLDKKQFERAEDIFQNIFSKLINDYDLNNDQTLEDILTELQRNKDIKRIAVLYGGRIVLTYK